MLLFTNTDSLVYDIKTNGIYQTFHKNKEKLDFSGYLEKSKLYDQAN